MNDMEKSLVDYESPEGRKVLFPGFSFYWRMLYEVWRANRLCVRGSYDMAAWCSSSHNILTHLEWVGVRFSITGRENLGKVEGPCILLGNHMSTLETFILPWAAQRLLPMTYVLKESLTRYPLFGRVARSREPIVVSRSNPREDLVAVLNGGEERLAEGISIVIFPQTTRVRGFDPSQFNTIGAKLARRAGVPIVPVAIRSDAWGSQGWLVKDFGKIDPALPVRIEFGAPLEVSGNGKAANEAAAAFISGRLREWGCPVGAILS